MEWFYHCLAKILSAPCVSTQSNYVCMFLVKDTMHTVKNSSLDVPHINMSMGRFLFYYVCVIIEY